MDSSRTLPADVTRELLDELLAFKGLFAAAAAVLTEGLLHLDENRTIVRFTPGAQAILGYAPASVIGNDIRTLLHESNDADPCVAPSQLKRLKLVLRDSAGNPCTVDARSIALARGENIEGWLVAFSAKPRVDEIEQLKNELVSTVSHELKTPLAAIKAYTSTLRQNPALYDARREEFLGVVEQQADRLSRMVDDMLLVTRVQSEQLLRRRVTVAFDKILDDALGELAHDPVLHPIVRQTAEAQISGDPERLRDILRNLLENALKYSPSGGTISIRADQAAEHTTVEVRDQGLGIDEEHLPYIFDRFYRVESEITSSVGGSGLGLYIVHALVRAHGGTIEVRSEPGNGTTFTLRFPLR